MKTILPILFVVLVAFCSPAQSLPPAIFEWEAPASMNHVVGYRLEWGPQQNAEVPTYQTLYQVDDLPTGLLFPVSVSSVGTSTNSNPTTIYLFNVTAEIEESENMMTWTPIASVLLRGPRKPNSFLRLAIRPN